MLRGELFGALSDFFLFAPEQVSIAKVLLGVFGVAVVVILIAVPTAVFLNGEYLLSNAAHVGIFSVSPLNTSDRKYFKHASLCIV